MVLVFASALDVNWLSTVTRRTIFDIQLHYKMYRFAVNNDGSFLVTVLDVIIDDPNDFIAREALWETYCGPSFTRWSFGHRHRFIAACTDCSDFEYWVRWHRTKSRWWFCVVLGGCKGRHKKVGRQKELPFVAEKLASDALYNAAGLRKQVVGADKRYLELMTTASKVLSQIWSYGGVLWGLRYYIGAE